MSFDHKEALMRYTLFLHYLELTPADLGDDAWEAGKAAFHGYAKALDEAGVLASAEVLQPSASSTTLKLDDGRLRVQDGPYADTKEQIGGTFVLDVPDLDAAIAWAEKCPAAQWGTIEIRPSAVRYSEGAWRPA
jgi:hypothetical protein